MFVVCGAGSGLCDEPYHSFRGILPICVYVCVCMYLYLFLIVCHLETPTSKRPLVRVGLLHHRKRKRRRKKHGAEEIIRSCSL